MSQLDIVTQVTQDLNALYPSVIDNLKAAGALVRSEGKFRTDNLSFQLCLDVASLYAIQTTCTSEM